MRVGLTGTLAAGKTAVGRLFESWGATRIDADELARVAVAPGSDGLAAIRAEWGEKVLAPDGSLDRSAMRAMAFDDADALRRLEQIVHGAVRRLREEEREQAREAGAALVVEEVPLLYEVGLEAEYDVVIVVDAPFEVRRERAMRARDWVPGEFEAIDAVQLSAGEKRARADFVIENAGTPAELEEAARAVWHKLLSMRDIP